jgi:adenosylhomocysteine nucleosidase
VRPTGIVAAMREELAPLLALTEVERRGKIAGSDVVWGMQGREAVVIASTGEGHVSAERGTAALLDEVPVSRLLVMGVSGGLTAELEPGALVVGRRVLQGGEAVPAPDGDWVEEALRIEGAVAGTMVTTREILCTPASKAAAREQLVDAGPAVVDLETAIYAEAAATSGVPWLAVRAVCDTAEEELPIDFNQFRDSEGRVQRDRIMYHAMRHPSVVRGLRDMQQRVSLCADRLASFVQRLLDPSGDLKS